MEPDPDIRNEKGGVYGVHLDSDCCYCRMVFSAGLAVTEVRHLHLNETGLPVGRQGYKGYNSD
jgi:hypothetical protein